MDLRKPYIRLQFVSQSLYSRTCICVYIWKTNCVRNRDVLRDHRKSLVIYLRITHNASLTVVLTLCNSIDSLPASLLESFIAQFHYQKNRRIVVCPACSPSLATAAHIISKHTMALVCASVYHLSPRLLVLNDKVHTVCVRSPSYSQHPSQCYM